LAEKYFAGVLKISNKLSIFLKTKAAQHHTKTTKKTHKGQGPLFAKAGLSLRKMLTSFWNPVHLAANPAEAFKPL